MASGAQLRLAAPAEGVRRVLRLDGLDRLVLVHPSREAALAAGRPAAQPSAAGSPQVSQDLLGGIVRNLFQADLSPQAALDATYEVDRQYIMQALHYLDQTIRDIRDQVFVTGWRQSPPPSEPPDGAW